MRALTDEEKARPDIKDMTEDLGKVSAITAIQNSEGGQILVRSLITDVVSSVDTLSLKYATLSLQEFIALCADMKSKLDLLRVITRAKKNKKGLEGLIAETLQE